MKSLRHSILPCFAILAMSLAACDSWSRNASTDPSVSRVNFRLEPSTREIVAGETVTIFARSYDTFGRDPQIAWTTTSGRLTTEQNDRVARIKFDQPGTYFVTAVLTADGREIKRESVEIRVKPLS